MVFIIAKTCKQYDSCARLNTYGYAVTPETYPFTRDNIFVAEKAMVHIHFLIHDSMWLLIQLCRLPDSYSFLQLRYLGSAWGVYVWPSLLFYHRSRLSKILLGRWVYLHAIARNNKCIFMAAFFLDKPSLSVRAIFSYASTCQLIHCSLQAVRVYCYASLGLITISHFIIRSCKDTITSFFIADDLNHLLASRQDHYSHGSMAYILHRDYSAR